MKEVEEFIAKANMYELEQMAKIIIERQQLLLRRRELELKLFQNNGRV